MSKFRYFVASAIAVACMSAHADLVIDDFTTAQGEVSDNTTGGGGSAWSQVCSGGGDILGGCRELYVERTGGDAAEGGSRAVRASVDGSPSRTFNVSADSQVKGFGVIRWDGAGQTNSVGTLNMGLNGGLGVDLIAAGADKFRIIVSFADPGLPNPDLTFQIGVYTTAGNFTTLDVPAPAFAGPGLDFLDVSFAEILAFGTSTGSGADFTQVRALQAIVNIDDAQTAFDVSVRLVSSVPEPTSIALTGLALLGLGSLRRRKSIK